MSEVHEISLGDLAAETPGAIAIGPFGSRMKTDTYSVAGVPIIRGTNISQERGWKGDWVYVSDEFADTMPNCNAVAGDLVFPHRGAIGEVAIVPDDKPRYMISTSLMKFTADRSKVSPEFLFYFFRSPRGRFEILRYSSQVGTPGIGQPLTSLRQFKVPLLPLGQQYAVAALLSSLDEKIDLNRRMNETLEAMAQAFFKDWFVNFGPTRAKMQGRRPYLAPDLWSLFPDTLDSVEVPAGWSEATLSDFSQLNSEVWTSRTAPPVIEYVDLSNTKWGEIEQTQSLAWVDAPSRAQRVLRPGDTIVGTVRPGNGSYALVATNGLTGSTGFAVLRPTRPEYREFVYLAATARETIDTLSHLADGAAYPAVRPEVVAMQPITLPAEKCLVEFSHLTRPLLNRMQANREENRTLAKTRD
jgi:type I restriction enzyme S subunit